MILHGLYENGNVKVIDKDKKIKKSKFNVLIIPADDESDVFDYIQTKRVKKNIPEMTDKEIEDIIHKIRKVKS